MHYVVGICVMCIPTVLLPYLFWSPREVYSAYYIPMSVYYIFYNTIYNILNTFQALDVEIVAV